jgi:hypothetical protein
MGIIGADGYNADVFVVIVLPLSGHFSLHMLHILAMPTDEHDQHGFFVGKGVQRDRGSCDHIGSAKCGASVPKANMVDGVATIVKV